MQFETPSGSPVLVDAPEGHRQGGWSGARGTGSAQQGLALGSCWLFTGQDKDKLESDIWYRAILGSFVTAA